MNQDFIQFATVYGKYIDSLYALDNISEYESLAIDILTKLKRDFDTFVEKDGWVSTKSYLPYGVIDNWDMLPYETKVLMWHMAKECHSNYLAR